MKGDAPTGGSGGGPAPAVNRLAPQFSMLPPKLPGKGDRSGSTLTLKFRILPGWSRDDEDNLHQNTQLNQKAVEQEEEIDDNKRDQLIGDWAYKIRSTVYVRHYDKQTRQVSYSWFPGLAYRDIGADEPECIFGPVHTAAWNWYNGLKSFRTRSENLNDKYKDNFKEKFRNELKDEYDLSSVFTVLDVGMPTETYFVQVIPLSLGMEKLDYHQEWKQTLLPIDQKRFKKAFINQFTQKKDDPDYVNEPLSPETSQIGTDVVSLEHGNAVAMYGQGTVGVFEADKSYPLNPEDGWMDPNVGAWKEWDKVFSRTAPGDLIEDLVSVTSKGAVDWALEDTEFENLIPERIRGAGKDFSLEPKAKASEVVNESQGQSESREQTQAQEDTPQEPAPAQPAAPAEPATPAPANTSASGEEPEVDPSVREVYDQTLAQMQNTLQENHETQEEA